MKESAIVTRILKFLNRLPHCKAIKIHGSPYMEAGTPDILGCYHGQMFAFEVKTTKGKTSKIQDYRLSQWGIAGALAKIVIDEGGAQSAIRECIINSSKNDHPIVVNLPVVYRNSKLSIGRIE